MLLPTATLFIVLLLQRAQAFCFNTTCLREVELAGAKASADCSSYLLAGPIVTSSTVYIITTTVTGIETIWSPSISYSIWQSTTTVSTPTPQTIGTQTSSRTTITKREVVPRATQIIPTYASDCGAIGAYTSACSCVGVDIPQSVHWTTISTTTTTKIIPTATHTATAVFTREVCNPENNYGFIYNTISWDIPSNFTDYDGTATFRYYTLDHHACCAACYGNGPPGCYFYWMNLTTDGGICELAILDEVRPGMPDFLGPPSPHCPNGISPAVDLTPGNVAGAGPCLDGWLKTAY